jgi:hypothetical protein
MMPLASIRQIAKMTFIPPATGFPCLTKSLHFALNRLRSVPHRVSHLQQRAWFSLSKKLLKLLESMRHDSRKYMVRLGAVLFDLSTDYESIWLSPEDEAPRRER